MRVEKSDLRRHCLAKRQQLSKEQKRDASEKITAKLLAQPAVKRAKQVLCYLPTKGEVDTTNLLSALWQMDKQVYLPRCLDRVGNMEFYKVDDFSQVQTGMYGIKEPAGSCPMLQPVDGLICILPGVGFTKTGDRLGYGKGYYDRFLSKIRAITIGICYNQCIVAQIPRDEYDRTMDLVITQHATYPRSDINGG